MSNSNSKLQVLKRGLHLVLILVLLVGMLPSTSLAYSPAITNPSVGNALDGMEQDGIISSTASAVMFLDFSNRQDIIGDVDISELKTAYPNLMLVKLDGTNVVNVLNPAAVANVTYSNTFAAGKTLSYGGTIVSYQDSMGDLPVSALLAAIKMTDANGQTASLPNSLLDSVGTGTVTINNTQYSVTAGGSVSGQNMAAIPAGTYSVTVRFPYANSTSWMTCTVQLKISRVSYAFTSNLLTVYKGGNGVDFVLKKYDVDGTPMSVSLNDYDFHYTASDVTLTPSAGSDGKSIIIHAEADGPNPASGYVVVYSPQGSNAQVARAELVVGTNAAVSQFELVEYNGGTAGVATTHASTAAAAFPPAPADTLYLQGGTSISSMKDASTVLQYTGGTTYLFREGGGGAYLPYRYLSQARAIIGTDSSGDPYSLNCEFIAVEDPALLSGEKILGVTFTSGYLANEVWDGSSTPITVELKNGGVIPDQQIALNFESYAAAHAMGYEVYLLPAAASGASTTKANIETWINSGDVDPSARYTVNSDGMVSSGSPNIAEAVAGDYANLVVAAYYSSGGQRFILNSASMAWYQNSTNPVDIISGPVTSLGNTSISADLNGAIAGGHSNVLELYSAAEAGPADIYIVIHGLSASLNLQAQFGEPEITEYILAPADYVFSSSTSLYKEELEYVKANLATVADRRLYEYNVEGNGGTHAAVESLNILVYGVLNTQTVQEVQVSCDGVGTPTAAVSSSDNSQVNPALRTVGNSGGFMATLLHAGPGDNLVNETREITVANPSGLEKKLTVTIGRSKISGTYSIYEDYLGSRFTDSTVLKNAYDNSNSVPPIKSIKYRTDPVEIPVGTTAKEYLVPIFSNPQFYAGTVDWEDYRIDVFGTNNTIAPSASGSDVNRTSGANYYYLEWTAANEGTSVDQLIIDVSSTHTVKLTSGAVYDVESGRNALSISSNLKGVAPIVTGVAVNDSRSGSQISNGSYITAALGETVMLDNVQLRYSDNSIASAAPADLDSGRLKLVTDSMSVVHSVYQDQSGTVSGFDVKVMDGLPAPGAQIKFTYTSVINGVSAELSLNETIIGSTTPYIFYVRSDGKPKIEKIYLVAIGDKIDGNSSGAALRYNMGENYTVYPVIVDSRYYLLNGSMPASIEYDDVGVVPGISFVDGSIFSNAFTYSSYTTFPIVVSGGFNANSNPVCFDFTAVGEGTNEVRVDFDSSSITNSPYNTDAYTGSATLNIVQTADLVSKYVVDISHTAQSSSIALGQPFTAAIQYAVSDTSSGANSILISASSYQSNAISGVNSSTEKNILQVRPNEIPNGASFNISGSVSTLTILVDKVGTYKFDLSTVNNAGADVPAYGPRTVIFTVTGATATDTVRYSEPRLIQGLPANWSSIQETGTSLLDAAALSRGILKMVGNTNGTAIVKVLDENNNAMLVITVTTVDATLLTTQLTAAAGASAPESFAVGESKPLLWKLTYGYSDGSGSLILYEMIENANWVRVQGGDNRALNLVNDSVTAAGDASGYVVYQATHSQGGTELYWAYIDKNAAAATYSYAFSDNAAVLHPITQLDATIGAAPINTYIWDTTAVPAASSVSAAISSDLNVAVVSVSGNSVVITPMMAGTTIITAYTVNGSVTLNINVAGLTVPGYNVIGTVTDGTNAISGASVTLTGGAETYTGTTNSNGDFTVTDVPDGTYTVTITAGGYNTYSGSVTVSGANVAIPTITLTAAGAVVYDVTGTVTNGTNAISGASVTLTGGASNYTGTTNSNGTFTVTGVPDGTYTVTITAGGYNTYSGSVTVSGANVAVPTITLTAAGAAVTLTGGASNYTGTTNSNGTFTVTGVPDGTYTVTITASGYNTYSGSVTVSGANVTVPAVTLIVTSSSGSSGSHRGGGGGGGAVSATYTITITAPANGTVTVDKASAAKGGTVTVTAKAADGYQLDAVSAVDADGGSVALTKKSDGVYTFVMPAANVAVSAAFKAGGKNISPSAPYRDVDTSAWYHEYVNYVIEHGYMIGTSDTSFAPDAALNRAMMVQLFYNMEGKPASAGGKSFGDVSATDWYAGAIAWASENDIAEGYDNGNFGPNDNITREQMAAILYRYAAFKGVNVSASKELSAFSDADKVSAYALTAMKWAVAGGLISGHAGGELAPGETATRAEVATIITRFCERR